MPKAKKRKTSSTSRKSVSRKPIAVQRKVVKKDKSKIAWQIVLGLLAALFLVFLISKVSTFVTGNVPAVDAGNTEDGTGEYNESFLIEQLKDSRVWIEAFLGDLQGKDGNYSDQILLIKSMFLIISFFGIWTLVNKINSLASSNFFIKAFLTFSLGILFTRWIIGNSSVLSVLSSYNAVGMTLSALLPLIVIAYVLTMEIKGEGAELIRVFGWILFIGYLSVQTILVFKAVQTNENGIYNGGINGNLDIVLVYPIAMILSLIIIFATPFLRRSFMINGIGRAPPEFYQEQLIEVKSKLARYQRMATENQIDPNSAYYLSLIRKLTAEEGRLTAILQGLSPKEAQKVAKAAAKKAR